jgi:hypothetical protein
VFSKASVQQKRSREEIMRIQGDKRNSPDTIQIPHVVEDKKKVQRNGINVVNNGHL